jgi:predicted DNA-binding transcriptional regulator YafY
LKMAKQDRLSLIVDLLRRNGTMTASDLAEECRVSESTIQRDILALSDVRVAVCTDGGYRLQKSAPRSNLDLTTDEMLSLYLGLNSHPVQSVACFREAAKRALSKIESLASESVNGDYEVAKRHVAIQPGRNRSLEAAALIFQLMRQSVWPRQKVELHYVSPSTSELVRVVPKALLYKKDGWYLAGSVHRSIRYFRLDFIKSVTLCG